MQGAARNFPLSSASQLPSIKPVSFLFAVWSICWTKLIGCDRFGVGCHCYFTGGHGVHRKDRSIQERSEVLWKVHRSIKSWQGTTTGVFRLLCKSRIRTMITFPTMLSWQWMAKTMETTNIMRKLNTWLDLELSQCKNHLRIILNLKKRSFQNSWGFPPYKMLLNQGECSFCCSWMLRNGGPPIPLGYRPRSFCC